MARARNIKPGFFLNDVLAELSPLHRLLFVGLWTLADREGRLFDRPNQIKASVLPYDVCNPSRMLDELHSKGFILRYEIEGLKCVQVINFTKHQNPHVKEAASTIPAPGVNGASMEVAGLIPDSLNLIPDSGSLKPETLKKQARAKSKDVEAPELPDWLPMLQWDGWIEARTRARKPPTNLAKRQCISKLLAFRDKGHNVAQILMKSAMNNWADVFEPKE